jgi:hypothetical protein
VSQARALGYLLGITFRNRVARQLGRLRQPRYALGLLAGLAYLYLFTRNHAAGSRTSPAPSVLLESGLAFGLLAMVSWSWIYSSDHRALAYTTSEVALLFPAPVTRRALLNYKLARSQGLLLLNTAIWLLILHRGETTLVLPFRALALWCLFTTLHLHRLAASLTRISLLQHGRYGLRQHRLASGLVLLAGGLVLVAALQAGNRALAAPPGTAVPALLERALAAPLLVIVLAPFRLLAEPVSSISPAAWARAIPWALGLLAAHYVWVVRSNAAFEEAAAEASFARARLLAARRSGSAPAITAGSASPPLVRLAPAGAPAAALLWKNVTMLLRRGRLRTWSLIAFALALTLVVASRGLPTAAETAGIMLLVWSGFFFAIGPQWIRNDLRTDLAHLEVLRSFPLRPDAVVRAEAAASALLLSLSQLTLLLLGALALSATSLDALPGRIRWALAAGALVLLPAINFAGMMLQNGAALLFPGWVRVGAPRGGVETLGQGMLSAMAYLLLLALLLVFPLVGGGGLALFLDPVAGPWSLIPGAVAAAGILTGEAWLLSLWLGAAYERLDPPSAGVQSE